MTTFIGLLYAFIPDVSSAYWIFSVMTTQVYLIMYVLMFFAAIQLRRHQPERPRGYRGVCADSALHCGPSRFGPGVHHRIRTAVPVQRRQYCHLLRYRRRRRALDWVAGAGSVLHLPQAELEVHGCRSRGRGSSRPAAGGRPFRSGSCRCRRLRVRRGRQGGADDGTPAPVSARPAPATWIPKTNPRLTNPSAQVRLRDRRRGGAGAGGMGRLGVR